nr:hypothetical protein GCM10020241_09470 [Streptoalloteichus tenebrarius]
MTNAANAAGAKTSAGPTGFFESRTATTFATDATSTHSPLPVALLPLVGFGDASGQAELGAEFPGVRAGARRWGDFVGEVEEASFDAGGVQAGGDVDGVLGVGVGGVDVADEVEGAGGGPQKSATITSR